MAIPLCSLGLLSSLGIRIVPGVAPFLYEILSFRGSRFLPTAPNRASTRDLLLQVAAGGRLQRTVCHGVLLRVGGRLLQGAAGDWLSNLGHNPSLHVFEAVKDPVEKV